MHAFLKAAYAVKYLSIFEENWGKGKAVDDGIDLKGLFPDFSFIFLCHK